MANAHSATFAALASANAAASYARSITRTHVPRSAPMSASVPPEAEITEISSRTLNPPILAHRHRGAVRRSPVPNAGSNDRIQAQIH
jgi:hypothetical protein